jgi:hypothetical protein
MPLAKRLSLLEELFPIVEQAGAEEVVREALNEAARFAGIGIREMHMAYERHLATVAAKRPASQLTRPTPSDTPVVKGGGLTTLEDDLLLLLFKHDTYFVPVSQTLPLEWINRSSRSGTLLMALLNEALHGHFASLREVIPTLDDDLQLECARLSALPSSTADNPIETLASLNHILKSFHQRNIQTQIRRIDASIAACASGEIETINRLQSEKIALRKNQSTPPSLS